MSKGKGDNPNSLVSKEQLILYASPSFSNKGDFYIKKTKIIIVNYYAIEHCLGINRYQKDK